MLKCVVKFYSNVIDFRRNSSLHCKHSLFSGSTQQCCLIHMVPMSAYIFVLMHLDGCPSCLQIDYPDAHLMKPGQRQSYTPTNLERLMALEHEEVQVPAMRGRSFSEDRTQSYSSEASQVSCWQTDKIEVFTIWKCFTKWEVCSDTVNGLIR